MFQESPQHPLVAIWKTNKSTILWVANTISILAILFVVVTASSKSAKYYGDLSKLESDTSQKLCSHLNVQDYGTGYVVLDHWQANDGSYYVDCVKYQMQNGVKVIADKESVNFSLEK